MKILGLQKLTLIDYPGKVACTLFLFGCNFRCGFCHNPELVLDSNNLKEYSEEEVLDFLEKRKKYLDGVCITGGEPLISLEKEFLKKIKDLGYEVKIDTNGSFPEKLQEFIESGLVDFVAMDIKTSKENYSRVVGVDVNLDKIEKSIKIISKLLDYEFRTTVVKRFHDVREMKELIAGLSCWVGGKIKRFVLQGFKKEDKLIDESFKKEEDVDEDYLLELKKVCAGCCEDVVIRV